MFVDGTKERIFINTSLGCESKCKFCYLPSQDYVIGSKPKLLINFDEAIKKLISHPNFKKGKFGTILSIGCYSECWSKQNKSNTIQIIKSLINIGNPIQIATKRIITREELHDLNSLITWRGQLTIFISSTTISHYKVWEKSTSDPYKRFDIFKENLNSRIPLCLYLKPILPNITIQDINIYTNYITSYNLQAIVGCMFIYEEKSTDGQKAPIPSNKLFTMESSDEKTIFDKLFSLNLATYEHSVAAIEFWRSMQMPSHLISMIKSNLDLLKECKTVEEYLSKTQKPQDVILDLLKIYGYVDITYKSEKNNYIYTFNIGQSSSDLINLSINADVNLSGDALTQIQQTYQTVRLIETELADALYYPQDLRNKIIKAVIEELNITEELYKRILNNWFS